MFIHLIYAVIIAKSIPPVHNIAVTTDKPFYGKQFNRHQTGTGGKMKHFNCTAVSVDASGDSL